MADCTDNLTAPFWPSWLPTREEAIASSAVRVSAGWDEEWPEPSKSPAPLTPANPNYTAKQFSAMVAKAEARLAELGRAIEQARCEKDCDWLRGAYDQMREDLAYEHMVAEFHAYGPYAEHPSVARWA